MLSKLKEKFEKLFTGKFRNLNLLSVGVLVSATAIAIPFLKMEIDSTKNQCNLKSPTERRPV